MLENEGTSSVLVVSGLSFTSWLVAKLWLEFCLLAGCKVLVGVFLVGWLQICG